MRVGYLQAQFEQAQEKLRLLTAPEGVDSETTPEGAATLAVLATVNCTSAVIKPGGNCLPRPRLAEVPCHNVSNALVLNVGNRACTEAL